MGEKNYDPIAHTAEHLVNGTIARLLGCGRAFRHISRRRNRNAISIFSRNLTPEELEWVEQQVNEQIAAGLKVHDEILSVEEAATRYSLSRLPEGEETVRIVHIGDYDACPCIRATCGRHLRNPSRNPYFKRL